MTRLGKELYYQTYFEESQSVRPWIEPLSVTIHWKAVE